MNELFESENFVTALTAPNPLDARKYRDYLLEAMTESDPNTSSLYDGLTAFLTASIIAVRVRKLPRGKLVLAESEAFKEEMKYWSGLVRNAIEDNDKRFLDVFDEFTSEELNEDIPEDEMIRRQVLIERLILDHTPEGTARIMITLKSGLRVWPADKSPESVNLYEAW